MDSLVTAAAQALASGEALAALNYVSLREDPPALAIRGIAMAQLGDLVRAKTLLRRAARSFGEQEAVDRARCVVAEAEIDIVSRDFSSPSDALTSAHDVLLRHGDRANAAHALYLKIRRLLVLGQLHQAERAIERFDPSPLPAASRAAYELSLAGLNIRRLRISAARASLTLAKAAASEARIPSLSAEVANAQAVLDVPAARLVQFGQDRILLLDDVEALLSSNALVVDACRHVVKHSGSEIALERRPVLFALARALAEAWPGDVSRAELLARAFGAKHVDESHRVRLRVEIGRLRKALSGVAKISATRDGYALEPCPPLRISVLAPLSDQAHADVLALLSDGESWSTSALAVALGTSQRTIQRALDHLLASGKVQAVGHGRARRWMSSPMLGFTTTLLLPTAPPYG